MGNFWSWLAWSASTNPTAWISAIAATFSAGTAIASFLFALTSRKKSDTAKTQADRATAALTMLESQRNDLLASMDKRDAIREGAQPWEITQELNSGFRARNKLNVPLYNVDISSEDVQIVMTETPCNVIQDGESFTFVAFMRSARRVTISYSLKPNSEKKTFSEALPPELVKQ